MTLRLYTLRGLVNEKYTLDYLQMKRNYKWKLPIIVTMLDIAVSLILIHYNFSDTFSEVKYRQYIDIFIFIWGLFHRPIVLFVDWSCSSIAYGLIIDSLCFLTYFAPTFLVFFFVGRWIDNKHDKQA